MYIQVVNAGNRCNEVSGWQRVVRNGGGTGMGNAWSPISVDEVRKQCGKEGSGKAMGG